MWLRIFGICHLFAGIIQMVLAFAELGITARDDDELWTNPAIARYRFYMLYPAFAVIFVGLMVRKKGFSFYGIWNNRQFIATPFTHVPRQIRCHIKSF